MHPLSDPPPSPPPTPLLEPADLVALEALIQAPRSITEDGVILRTYPQATLEGLTATITCADHLQEGHRLYLNSSW